MPAISNVYTYRDAAGMAPIQILGPAQGVRTLGGSYVNLTGSLQAGQQVIVGNPYRVCEGKYNAGNNQGAVKTCSRIGANDHLQPESDYT
jgi:hypothetical protein